MPGPRPGISFFVTPPKLYQGMKSTLSFPTTPRNTTNYHKNRYSRERSLWFHSLLGKHDGDDHLLICDTAPSEASSHTTSEVSFLTLSLSTTLTQTPFHEAHILLVYCIIVKKGQICYSDLAFCH